MHYQLFVPAEVGSPLGTPQQALEKIGLSDLIPNHEGIGNRPGPKSIDGQEQHGTLIAWRRPGKNERMHYNANEQTWIPALKNGEAEAGRYWVGFWNDSPPTPEDLLRPYSHRGETVELGDGNHWRFPVIQSLPHTAIASDDGTWRFQLQRQYHDLSLEAQQMAKRELEGAGHQYSTVANFVMRGLSQNYRILPEVVSHLELFSTENIFSASAILLSWELENE